MALLTTKYLLTNQKSQSDLDKKQAIVNELIKATLANKNKDYVFQNSPGGQLDHLTKILKFHFYKQV